MRHRLPPQCAFEASQDGGTAVESASSQSSSSACRWSDGSPSLRLRRHKGRYSGAIRPRGWDLDQDVDGRHQHDHLLVGLGLVQRLLEQIPSGLAVFQLAWCLGVQIGAELGKGPPSRGTGPDRYAGCVGLFHGLDLGAPPTRDTDRPTLTAGRLPELNSAFPGRSDRR